MMFQSMIKAPPMNMDVAMTQTSAVTAGVQLILDEYEVTDEDRRKASHPRFGGLFVLHHLAEPS